MNFLRRLPFVKHAIAGANHLHHPEYLRGASRTRAELAKTPSRTEIINFLLSCCPRETTYLEIGVRNPEHNFNHIRANAKFSVDPGIEFKSNPVDFKMTSDDFFRSLAHGRLLDATTRFDVIFIDGLHLAEQVDRDIEHALQFVRDDGFIVLHDCNPPTEWHARESYDFYNTPAQDHWNGTTWKAFVKWRTRPGLQSCCVDTDWGVGILSKKRQMGNQIAKPNPFYEYAVFDQNRAAALNLVNFDQLRDFLERA